jgi:peptidoglycan/LPS O-acetylase OafA/YrhL
VEQSETMKFQRLEAVRGFAAFYVCLTHLFDLDRMAFPCRMALSFGQEAVMLFFILSGFVIRWAAGKRDSGEPFGRYFAKRFTRIYSVWGCAIAALCLISWAEAGHFVPQPAGRWLGNLLMLQDWRYGRPAVICDPLYGDTPLWSLHYEWWFYMLFPLVNALAAAWWKVHVVGAIAVANAVLYAFLPNPVSRLFMYLSIWWIGVHAAECLRASGTVRLKDLRAPLAYVAVTAIPGLCVTHHWWSVGKPLGMGVYPVAEPRHLLGAVVLVCLAFMWRRFEWFGFASTLGRFAFLAPISFSLYVIHYRSIGIASYFSFLGNPFLEQGLYVAVTLLFCCGVELVFYPRLRALLRL